MTVKLIEFLTRACGLEETLTLEILLHALDGVDALFSQIECWCVEALNQRWSTILPNAFDGLGGYAIDGDSIVPINGDGGEVALRDSLSQWCWYVFRWQGTVMLKNEEQRQSLLIGESKSVGEYTIPRCFVWQ